MFLITQAGTLMSGNKANQVVDLTCEEPIEISDNKQGREAIDLSGTRIPAPVKAKDIANFAQVICILAKIETP